MLSIAFGYFQTMHTMLQRQYLIIFLFSNNLNATWKTNNQYLYLLSKQKSSKQWGKKTNSKKTEKTENAAWNYFERAVIVRNRGNVFSSISNVIYVVNT
jgi:hypothetical protein